MLFKRYFLEVLEDKTKVLKVRAKIGKDGNYIFFLRRGKYLLLSKNEGVGNNKKIEVKECGFFQKKDGFFQKKVLVE